MGILGLSRLIADVSPGAIKEIDLKSLFGRRIAIDASMCIYQFMIAIRSNEYTMTNEAGEATSHLVGLFYRTIKLLETGIKPVYVFDGKAPQLKCGELSKRAERRNEAQQKLEEAKELQNVEDIQRFNKRLVKVTRQHNEDCKKLLQLLGIPIVQAPSEAEAQCAQLCKEGLVYAAATEDMDALTFGCPRLIRNLTSANNEKIKEFHVNRILEELDLTQDQFIDLSILMGCDYCDNIRGIGGKKGLDLIRKFNNIEGILKNKFDIEDFADVEIEYNIRSREVKAKEEQNSESEVKTKEEQNSESSEVKTEDVAEVKEEVKTEENDNDETEESDENVNDKNKELNSEDDQEEEDEDDEKNKKNTKKKVTKPAVPENWPFRGARKLFQEPLVLKNEVTEAHLKPKDIDEEGVVQFLCKENGFSEDRVRSALRRAKEAKNKGSQTRIDSFFKKLPTTGTSPKRSAPSKDNKTSNKRGRKAR